MSVVQPDVTLHMDLEGVIQRVALSDAIESESLDGWLGRPWRETVADGAADWVRRMLDDAKRRGVSAFAQVTQRFPSGRELQMEYTAVSLGGASGLVAVGRSLQVVSELQSRLVAAQQAMERDYWKLREIETRYRLLFDASNEAVLLISAADHRIVEVNPAAMRAIGVAAVGFAFVPELLPEDREPFLAMLRQVREQGKAPALRARLGGGRRSWLIRATHLAADAGPVFLLQLTPAGVRGEAADQAMALDRFIERTPDAFIAVDIEGRVQGANPAFLELAEEGALASVVGQRLSRWLEQPGADGAALLETVRRHGVVRHFATRMSGAFGSERRVEISAALDRDDAPRQVGIFIRDTGPEPAGPAANGSLASALSALSARIGGTSLPELVRDTVGAVEQHYIEEALVRTGGNRTAAAELLGLSRQSLYVKLNRYGMEGAIHAVHGRSD